ncbi:MAG: P-loop NTPase [Pseudomonadota bacterium]
MPSRLHMIASGKGGVGKSTVAVGLAAALAADGRRVVLVDGDMSQGTLHLHLGSHRPAPGIREFFASPRATLPPLLQPCPALGFELLGAGGETLGMTHLHVQRIARLVRALRKLDRDDVIVDLAAGSANNTLDLYGTGDLCYIVLTPDPPAVLAAFAFLKAALFRAMRRSLPDDSELGLATAALYQHVNLREAPQPVVLDLVAGEQRDQLEQIRANLHIRAVVNFAESANPMAPASAVASVARERLGLHTQAVGALPASSVIAHALRQGQPWPNVAPELALRLRAWTAVQAEPMPAPPSPVACVIGFNEEVVRGSLNLHVQTEDLGAAGQVLSLVYLGGRVVFRIQRPLLPDGEASELRATAVQHQHRTVILGILGGKLDRVLSGLREDAA